MRQIGDMPHGKDAQRFADYLLAQGVTTKLEEHAGGWSVWVREEEQVPRARQELEQFLLAPTDPRYVESARKADEVRAEQARRDAEYRKHFVDVSKRWQAGVAGGPYPLTKLMIGISVVLTLLTNFGHNALFDELTISSWQAYAKHGFQFNDILGGQVWRLFTPMFAHLSPMHLLFNMYWLYIFGRMIEGYIGTWRFGALICFTELASSIPEYVMSHPMFGGMSGVGYGLFGYIWMKQTFDPVAALRLSPNTALLFLVWFVLCMTGAVGPIANWAHGGGLVAGMLVGAAPTIVRRIRS